jgi:HEAT repeat protein
MRCLLAALLALALAGCGRTPATTAHGRPITHWVDSLADPDAGVRRRAARVLGNVGPADAAVLPALARAAADRDPLVRCEALQALAKIGPAAREAAAAVEACRHDRDPRVRAWAAAARQRIEADR